MVNFGKRLPGLMITSYRKHYVDYDALKKIVEASSTLDAAASERFLARLLQEIEKMDLFVGTKHAELVKAFNDAGASKDKIEKVAADLAQLRHFVGTNVIAITKAVKKHDKNAASAELSKRERVATLIRSCKGVNNLPALARDVDRALKRPASNLSIAINISEFEATTADKGGGPEDDETEAELRTLPNWLLSSALREQPKEQKSDDVLSAEAFFASYLKDWGLKEGGLKEGLLSDGDAAPPAGGGEWNVDFSSDATPWAELSCCGRLTLVSTILLKVAFIVFSLYAFICSLSFLADGFRLVAGRQAGEIFRNSEIFNNPIAGVLVGVLVTVLVQSSSTSTSIVITMVAASLLTVRQAISLIMGANIGTSVTSTIVALAQSNNRNEFRRAFAAATVHDMFNFLSVLTLLPIEAATGYLYKFSEALINASPSLTSADKPPDLLKALTKPFTKLIISLDKGVIKDIATANTTADYEALADARILKHFFDWTPETISDGLAGAIMLIIALTVLCVTLFCIVWTLKSLLKGRIAVWLHRSVNGYVPDIQCGGCTIPMRWLSGYLAMGMGVIVTILVQSSSITTSALTPLVGIGVINIERMYPTVLGANIGTCITGVLAALAADGSKLYLTLQVAYAHLLFNITGIAIWYAIWPLRAVPVSAAKFLGNTTAKYRWFALLYLFVCFFAVPGIFMGLSIASMATCVVVLALAISTMLFVLIVNVLQARRPSALPATLRDWEWLPAWMTSLEPFDRVVCAKLMCCKCCKDKVTSGSGESSSSVSRAVGETSTHHAEELQVATTRIEA